MFAVSTPINFNPFFIARKRPATATMSHAIEAKRMHAMSDFDIDMTDAEVDICDKKRY